jgi:hypothetical protein
MIGHAALLGLVAGVEIEMKTPLSDETIHKQFTSKTAISISTATQISPASYPNYSLTASAKPTLTDIGDLEEDSLVEPIEELGRLFQPVVKLSAEFQERIISLIL